MPHPEVGRGLVTFGSEEDHVGDARTIGCRRKNYKDGCFIYCAAYFVAGTQGLNDSDRRPENA